MKIILRSFTATSALCILLSSSAYAEDVALTTDKQKVSYVIGQQIGGSIKAQGVDIDLSVLKKSIEDAFTGAKPSLSGEEMQTAMMALQTQMMKKQQQLGGANKAAGDKFLAENKKKAGVVTTASGLQHLTLKEGKGPNPKASDTVEVHYRGTLLDGTEFDSSYKRNEPVSFPLTNVIPGWTEGIPLMKVGGKTKFFIPSDLAYGPAGRPSIPPNSVLIFEVELLSIK